jgi:hypothetical protein
MLHEINISDKNGFIRSYESSTVPQVGDTLMIKENGIKIVIQRTFPTETGNKRVLLIVDSYIAP